MPRSAKTPVSTHRNLRMLLIGLMIAIVGKAQTTVYWDTNGNTAGAGTSNGTWSTNNGAGNRNWTTSSAGTTSTQSWNSGDYAVFSAGTDNAGSFTVTVSGTQNVAGITVEEGNPTISSGILNFNSATPFVAVASGSTITFNSQLSGSTGLAKNGTGTMILTNAANNWTGAFSINAGLVQLNTSNVIPDGAAVTVASGATLQTDWGISETLGSLAGAGTVNYRTGTLTVGDTTSTTFSGVIENSYGTLVKQGTGSLTLSGANTYSGLTTINAGALIAAHDTALGSSTYGNTIASGGALQLQGNINLTEGQFSVAGTGVGGTGAIRNLSGSNTLNATLDLAGNTTIATDTGGTLDATGAISLGSNTLTVAGAGGTTFSGSITGAGNITRTDTGTLTLAGTGANTSGGALNINSGTVVLNKTAGTHAFSGSAINVGDGSGAASSAVLRLGASNQIADYTGTLTIATDGLFDVNNQAEKINVLAGTGKIDLGATGQLSIGVNSGSSTFGGTIAGAGTFIKEGSGSLTLAATLAITGELQLASGTLYLSGYSLTAGTLRITGNSTIDFAGGNSTLTATNFILDAGVTLTIANWTAAADHFFAQNWSGATLNVSGSDPMNRVVFGGYNANQTHWDSYDKQITPVPEPATYGALLLAGLTTFAAWRRFRRAHYSAN